MSEEINYLSRTQVRDLGLIHEINRLLLHPMGLALAMGAANEDIDPTTMLVRVWDYRDDPEGMLFGDDLLNADKAERVAELYAAKADERRELLGWVEQPAVGDGVRLAVSVVRPARPS